MKPIDFVYLFGVVGAICTLLVLYFTWQHNKLSSNKTTQTLDNTNALLQKNIILQEKADTQSNKIDELRDENAQLYKDLLSKSEELNKFLGASEAYPILVVNPGSSQSGDAGFRFRIDNEFEYPVYDIVINVFDFQHIIDNSELADGKYTIKKAGFDKSILFQWDNNHISAKGDVVTPKLFEKIYDGILYVKLKCRGSFVFQKIAFVKIENSVHVGYMVYDEKGNILKKWYAGNPSKEIKLKLEEKFDLIPMNVSLKID